MLFGLQHILLGPDSPLAACQALGLCQLLVQASALVLLLPLQLFLHLLCRLYGCVLQGFPLCRWVEPGIALLQLLRCCCWGGDTGAGSAGAGPGAAAAQP